MGRGKGATQRLRLRRDSGGARRNSDSARSRRESDETKRGKTRRYERQTVLRCRYATEVRPDDGDETREKYEEDQTETDTETARIGSTRVSQLDMRRDQRTPNRRELHHRDQPDETGKMRRGDKGRERRRDETKIQTRLRRQDETQETRRDSDQTRREETRRDETKDGLDETRRREA